MLKRQMEVPSASLVVEPLRIILFSDHQLQVQNLLRKDVLR